MLSWSPTKWRKAEAIRDRIMRGVGTDEPWITEDILRVSGLIMRDGHNLPTIAVHWRKPLSLAEVAQMAPTPEMRARPGRA